jgi:hypothetical protein
VKKITLSAPVVLPNKNRREISGGFCCDVGSDADVPRCCQNYLAVRKASSEFFAWLIRPWSCVI